MPNQVLSFKDNLKNTYIYGMNLAQKELLRDSARGISNCFEDPVIVNIGVDYGGSMYCLRLGAPGARLIGVDIHYHSNVDLSSLGAELIKGNSNKVHVQVPFPIHLIFIDGGHGYPIVKGDTVGWPPKVPVGGIVIFHDVELPGVKKAISEWVDSNWKKLVYIPGPFDWTSGMVAYQRC